MFERSLDFVTGQLVCMNFTLVAFGIFGLLAHNSEAKAQRMYPYIQTHVFELKPVGPSTKGFALFLLSGVFDGHETIVVRAPSTVAFPDTNLHTKQLTAFERRGEWFQPGKERLSSAMSGPLAPGTYTFEAVLKDGSILTDVVDFRPNYLEIANKIAVSRDHNQDFLVTWVAPVSASSFHVFLIPKDSTDWLTDIIQVSNPDHQQTELKVKIGSVKTGEYWIVVRCNMHNDGFPGYAAESWGISEVTYNLQ